MAKFITKTRSKKEPGCRLLWQHLNNKPKKQRCRQARRKYNGILRFRRLQG
ncbi:hypothetical protein LJC61_07105 [Ruminococcaceae bacterium OttesenSCG-928-A16]|nr:hypothetical protein [Ruminococcaceae bacterium OttesenSCG-928-A16]